MAKKKKHNFLEDTIPTYIPQVAVAGELRWVEYDYHPREGDVGLQQKWTYPDGRTVWKDVPTVKEEEI